MIFKLTEEQLMWVLEGKRYREDTVQMFRDHYVNGLSRQEAQEKNSKTQHFSYKKWSEFEVLCKLKCKEHGLTMSTILHDENDSDKIFQYDVVNKTNTD